MIYALCGIILAMTAYIGYVQNVQNADYKARYHELLGYIERRESLWGEERQKLLDRIQAPSYDHLKHHEVKVIKAQKEQPKETINLEVV